VTEVVGVLTASVLAPVGDLFSQGFP
jgi:hypothetical protein